MHIDSCDYLICVVASAVDIRVFAHDTRCCLQPAFCSMRSQYDGWMLQQLSQLMRLQLLVFSLRLIEIRSSLTMAVSHFNVVEDCSTKGDVFEDAATRF